MKHDPKVILKVLLEIGNYLPRMGFLCCAAEKAQREGKITSHEEFVFKQFISERIKGHYTVLSWLKEEHGIDYTRYPDNCRLEYRQRWLQSMIEEFSK